ncbi:unnamed protein product [Nippostrongylus brasiliensis]|uniref:Peptidase A2 domain-containing protein n=1 Tax=Nippostrongylus brasiliensis TaxID=27835 RepID=A0A0N4YLC4_NIPBR|nr:unnamed protein product [Nippostrongylus brasiliensis]
MQRIAARMAPGMVMDFLLGSKLYECLSDWKDSYYMLAALEAPEGQVFSEVRTVALRLERMRNAQRTVKANHWNSRREPTSTSATAKEQPTSSRAHTSSGSQAESQRWENRDSAHKAKGGLNKPREGPSRKPTGPKNNPTAAANASKPNGRQSFSTHLQSWCLATHTSSSAVSTKPYGEPCYCKIKVLGVEADALVDSGSVISIMPLGSLKRIKDTNVDLDGGYGRTCRR